MATVVRRLKSRLVTNGSGFQAHGLRTATRGLLVVVVASVAFSGSSVADPNDFRWESGPTKTFSPDEINYHKNKGLGAFNAYANRCEEDYSYLRDPGKQSGDIFEPLKFIPLDESKSIYVTMAGDERFRYDNVDREAFDTARLSKGAINPAFRDTHQREEYSNRTILTSDLHLGNHVRFCGQLFNGRASGRNVDQFTNPNWRQDLDWGQLFGEVMQNFGDAHTGIRVGRQEISLGNGVIVFTNAGPSRRQTHDGIRAYSDWGTDRIDLFAGEPTLVKSPANGNLFQNSTNSHEAWYIAYGSHDFPNFSILGAPARASIDPFIQSWNSANKKLAGPTTGRLAFTTPVGHDERKTFGARFDGVIGNFDYDVTGALQRGSFGGYSVRAWMVQTDWGYRPSNLPWHPRFGVHVDEWSGGRDTTRKITNTWNLIYAAPFYASTSATSISQANLINIQPAILVSPTSTIVAELWWRFFWRASSADAIYASGFYNAANNLNNTYGVGGRFVGSHIDLNVRWQVIPHVSLIGDVGEVLAGPVIKNAQGQKMTFVLGAVALGF